MKHNNPNDRNGILKVEKKAKVNKQGLSRYSVTLEQLNEGDIVFGFDEETQEYQKMKAVKDNGSLVLKDEKGFRVNFIDIIFKTEKEVIAYKNAPFM